MSHEVKLYLMNTDHEHFSNMCALCLIEFDDDQIEPVQLEADGDIQNTYACKGCCENVGVRRNAAPRNKAA